jgi:hypothetical protein
MNREKTKEQKTIEKTKTTFLLSRLDKNPRNQFGARRSSRPPPLVFSIFFFLTFFL